MILVSLLQPVLLIIGRATLTDKLDTLFIRLFTLTLN